VHRRKEKRKKEASWKEMKKLMKGPSLRGLADKLLKVSDRKEIPAV
jgi:hypothetical protein